MAVITDPLGCGQAGHHNVVLQGARRQVDWGEANPVFLWSRRHFRLLYGVPLRRDPMRRGDVQPNQGVPGGGSRGEDQAGV